MRVLQVGQLPKEMGGSYTTGVARVVGELSRYRFGAHEVFLYATNISNENAHKLHSEHCSYLGYVKRPLYMLMHALLHPSKTIKAFKVYRVLEKNTSFLQMEFIRDNFARVVKKVKPDLIHFHGSALSAMHFANNQMVPVLYSPHGLMWVGRDTDDADYQRMLSATRLNLSYAGRYTALNESVVKRLRLLGIENEKISIVPNGVDSQKFYYSESARREMREALGVKDQEIVFITVGLVIDRKGQLDFLKILNSLGIEYQYWIIGKGPDEAAIRQFAADNSIQERVKLLGYIEDKEIYKYHSAADFYSHSSYFEAQALSEIEACACGLPVIVNKTISDTVVGDPQTDEDNYYVADFAAVDKAQLTSWLKRERPQRASRSQYDWQNVADMYAKCYESMTARK